MCKPFDRYEDHAHGVVSELVSALSALNMEPDPIPAEEIERIREDRGYAWLSDTDRWVSHSMEHIHQAIREAEKAGEEISKLKGIIHRLEVTVNSLLQTTELNMDDMESSTQYTIAKALALMGRNNG